MLLEDAWVAVPVSQVVRTSYVDLSDLKDCLEAYYAGDLDSIADLTRLYLPLREVIPNNPLRSQLDSNLMFQALSELSQECRAVLEFNYCESDDLRSLLVHYCNRSGGQDFSGYLAETFQRALLELSDRVWKLL